MKKPYREMTLPQFMRRFRTEPACREYLFKLKWPHGFICPFCGHGHYYELPKRRLYQCKACGHQSSVTADTVMHKTRTPLRKWFCALPFSQRQARPFRPATVQKAGIELLCGLDHAPQNPVSYTHLTLPTN